MTGLNDMPLEIIVNIYEYLTINEINRARVTCHQLFNASLISSNYLKNSILKMAYEYIDDSVIEIFKKFVTKFQNIHMIFLNDIPIRNEQKLINFFSISNIRANLKCLIFESIEADLREAIKFKLFYKILEKVEYLTELKLPFFNLDYTELLKFSKTNPCVDFKNLNSLSLMSEKYLILFAQVENLKTLHIAIHDQIQENWIQSVHQIIAKNKKTLTLLSLEFRMFFPPSFPWSMLLECNLILKSFNLKYYEICSELISFLTTQTQLTKLCIDGTEIKDQEIIQILDKLTNLERLELLYESHLTNLTINEIFHLKKLKCLILRECDYMKKEYIFSNHNFNNLQILKFQSSYNQLGDIELQFIIKNCTNLRSLSLYGLEFTDYGLTGIDLKTKMKIGFPISNLDKLSSLCLRITQCSLINGLKLPKLKILGLDIENCQSLSDLNPFEIMTRNCPSIEFLVLVLSGFDNVLLYELVQLIIKNLCLLKKIYIRSKFRHFADRMFNKFNYKKYTYSIKLHCSCKKCSKSKELCETFLQNRGFTFAANQNHPIEDLLNSN